MTVVIDNTKDVGNAVHSLTTISEAYDITCAAHSIELVVNNRLRQDRIDTLIQLCSYVVVCHFKHSNLAKQALTNVQEQLGLTQKKSDTKL